DGGTVVLDTQMLIEGIEGSPSFIFTDNGMPTLDAGHGFQLGVADDLANDLLAQLNALGLLSLPMPAMGGTFHTINSATTVPPMISADPADGGKMRVILGDVMMAFMSHGQQVAKAAVNAKIELKVDSAGGSVVALQLGTPDVFVDVLN